jgi:enoyl-CoA hydratase
MRNDRLSALEQWSLDWDEATAFEVKVGMETLQTGSAVEGATRFAAGQGRSGAF